MGEPLPQYAILSHTWGTDDEEITFRDLREGTGKDKLGYCKLSFCGRQAAKDGLQFFWIDTCCVDQSSSAELSEAINSMFQWYRKAARCYVYLSDVSTANIFQVDQSFKKSRWFTRGWTLQELLAPTSVEFFSSGGNRIGDRESLMLQINEVTGIPLEALQGNPLTQFGVDARFSWLGTRTTKREEDAAYCLLGIFDVSMPLIYGEGRRKAFYRLRKEINEYVNLQSSSHSPFKEHPKSNCTSPFVSENPGLIKRLEPSGEFEQLESNDNPKCDADVPTIVEATTLQDCFDLAEKWSEFGKSSEDRFERTGSLKDFEDAVNFIEKAIDVTAEDCPSRPTLYSRLGNVLCLRFEGAGGIHILNRAIDVVNAAVETTPQDIPERADRLNSLGYLLGKRFESTGLAEHLEDAIEISMTIVGVTSQDHPDRASRLSNLAYLLGRRFEQAESIDDLNHAISLSIRAVTATPQNHPDRHIRRSRFIRFLEILFEQIKSVDDFKNAVALIDEAVRSGAEDIHDRPALLARLGNLLYKRFEKTGSIDNLSCAIKVVDLAVYITRQGCPARADRLISLACLLGRRFECTRATRDLERAIEFSSSVVAATPDDHPARVDRLSILGRLLCKQFELTRSIDDLECAIEVSITLLEATPQDSSDLADRRGSLESLLNKADEYGDRQQRIRE